MLKNWIIVVYFVFKLALVDAVSSWRTVAQFANSTSRATYPTTTDSSPDICCFVVQDTIDARYWAHYSTTTVYGVANVTSVVTSITRYIDTIITNYETFTTASNRTFITSTDIATYNIVSPNYASGFPATTIGSLNGTATTFLGETITSPAAFFIYSTVKLITVPAVTRSDGRLACVTLSTLSQECRTATYSNINSNAEAYFSVKGSTTQLGRTEAGATAMVSKPSQSALFNVSATKASLYPSAEITFSRPFIYRPLQGAVATLEDTLGGPIQANSLPPRKRFLAPPTTSGAVEAAFEDYGYVPKALLNWMIQEPDHLVRYPQLKSCLPGGPTIIPDSNCGDTAPVYAFDVPDLTITGSPVTITSAGCFHLGACSSHEASIGPTKSSLILPSHGAISNDVPAAIASAVLSAPEIRLSLTPVSLTSTQDSSVHESRLEGKPTTASTMTTAAYIDTFSTHGSKMTSPFPMSSTSTNDISRSTTSSESDTTVANPEGLGSMILGAFGTTPMATDSSKSMALDSGTLHTTDMQTLMINIGSEVLAGFSSLLTPSAPSPGATDPLTFRQGDLTMHPSNSDATPIVTLGSRPTATVASSWYIVGSNTLTSSVAPVINSRSTGLLALTGSAAGHNGVISEINNTPTSISESVSKSSTSDPYSNPSSSVSGILVGSQTLIPGASPIVISGVTVSLASSGNDVIIGQSTLTLPESRHNASITSSIGSGTTNNVTTTSHTRSLHTDTSLPGPATTSSSPTGRGNRLDLEALRPFKSVRLTGFAIVILIYYQV